MTNMRKKNHLPLFRDDLSIFDDFFQSTKGKTRKDFFMTAIISFICVFALFAFVGCFFFSMLMFSGDGTEHPVKDGFKFLGFSFAGLFVFVLTLFMSLSPFNQTVARQSLPLNKTFVSFGDGSGLVVDKKPDLAYPLSDEETLINLRTEHDAKLQPMNQAIDKVEFKTSKKVTKATLEICQNAFGLTESILVLE